MLCQVSFTFFYHLWLSVLLIEFTGDMDCFGQRSIYSFYLHKLQHLWYHGFHTIELSDVIQVMLSLICLEKKESNINQILKMKVHLYMRLTQIKTKTLLHSKNVNTVIASKFMILISNSLFITVILVIDASMEWIITVLLRVIVLES